MLPRIEQEIPKRVTHFRGRLERAHMIAILDHLPFALHQAIQGSGDANVQASDCPSECNSIPGLDHNVDVVCARQSLGEEEEMT